MPGFTTRPEIRGTFGVVATTHWLASSVGMSVLEKGGNAFDAAVAAGFHAAGGRAASQRPARRGADPRCGTRSRGAADDLRPGRGARRRRRSRIQRARARPHPRHRPAGGVACPAPSTPGRGCCAITARCRSPRSWRRRSAMPKTATRWCRASATRSRRSPSCSAREWPSSAALYLPGGEPPGPGRLFRNPALAATYQRVLAEAEAGGGDRERQIDRARDAWYRGFVADAIDRFCRDEKVIDFSGRRHHGLLTADDMARWQAPVEAPLTYDYRGYTVLQGRAVEPGAGAAAAAGAARRLRPRRHSTRPGPISSTPSSNAPSSPMPIARRGTATPISSTCRWRRC